MATVDRGMSSQGGGGLLQHFQLKGVLDVGRTVGNGSYASVKELNYCGLKCVGKKLYALLYNIASDGEKIDMLQNFAGECELLSGLHHPCIVQFLGVYSEGDSQLPVLVMEYLHTTLAECLKKYGVLPEEITYGILRDVALGLRYLHEHLPPIIHRDLSANNVLLTTDMSAKISDLGVAKMLNLSPAKITQKISTQAPGTPCYMPPEALVSTPAYTSKIDNYSYGVLMIHVLCGRWPFPDDAFCADPEGSLTPVMEVDRRAVYLREIGMEHPLIGLIKQCLSNAPKSRPEASEILFQVEKLASQFPPSFANKVEMLRRINSRSEVEEVAALRFDIDSKNSELESQRDELESERSQNQALREENKMQRKEVESLKSQLEKLSIPLPKPTSSEPCIINPQTRLQWRRCADLPVGMGRPHSVLVRGRVYVGGGLTDKKADHHLVFEYDPERDGWATLPLHPLVWFALGRFHGRVITVGGVLVNLTGKVLSYCEETRGWEEYLEPLLTARCLLSIITTESAIIACGGTDSTYKYCVAVEVYTDDSRQWHTTDPLPIPCAIQRSVTVDDTCYLLGGNDGTNNPTTTVICAPVHSLVEKATSFFQRSVSMNEQPERSPTWKYFSQRSASSPRLNSSSAWKILRDAPLKRSAGAALGGHLLAIGGYNDQDQASEAMYVYLPPSNSWARLTAGGLPAAVRSATAVQLADHSLLVCGGRDSLKRAIKTVYMCST